MIRSVIDTLRIAPAGRAPNNRYLELAPCAGAGCSRDPARIDRRRQTDTVRIPVALPEQVSICHDLLESLLRGRDAPVTALIRLPAAELPVIFR